MARSLNGTTDYMSCSAASVTAVPLTMACWGNINNVTNAYVLMSLASSFNERFTMTVRGDLAGDHANMVTVSGGVNSAAATTNAYTAGTWTHFCGVTASATSRACYINGTGKGTDTASRTPSSITTTLMGASFTPPSTFLAGSIAEAGIWNIALSDADVASLANGVSPLFVRPDALVDYWPLVGITSPEINLLSNTRTMTLSGSPTTAAHTRIFMPSGNKVWRMPAAAVAASSIVMRRNLSPVGTRAGSRQVHWN